MPEADARQGVEDSASENKGPERAPEVAEIELFVAAISSYRVLVLEE